jgi:NAD(P)-dependent dehydrogenase (short-subunit alcohol dehydrogenase family)
MTGSPPPLPQTIVVTGAGRGIGRAVALHLARHTGAGLLLVSRTDKCQTAAADCNQLRSGCATALRWDLADWQSGAPLFSAALDGASGPVGLVHAAGVLGPSGPLIDADFAAWWKAMEVNLGAGVRLTQLALSRMRRDGGGRVVLFAGGGAAYGYPLFSSYGTAKAALVRFVETVAMELGNDGPVLTIIAPGANETDMLAEVRKAGGIVKTTVSIDEPSQFVLRLMTEDTRGLHGRFVHVRDGWDSAIALSDDTWKLRRVQ